MYQTGYPTCHNDTRELYPDHTTDHIPRISMAISPDGQIFGFYQ